MKRNVTTYSSLGLLAVVIILFFFKPVLLNEPSKIDKIYFPGDVVKVVAHRGSHAVHPENSLSAIKESIKNNIDIIEVDLRLTKDSVFVLMHDEKIDRTTTGKGLLKDFDFEDLNDFKLLFNNVATSEQIPTLSQALELAGNKTIINLDLKFKDLRSIKKLVRKISETGSEKNIILSIRDIDLIPKIFAYNPEINIMPVVTKKRDIRKVLEYDFINIIQVYHRPYSKSIRKQIAEKDLKVWVNALKKYDRIQERTQSGFRDLLAVKKVHYIQTDYPEDLLKELQKLGLHP